MVVSLIVCSVSTGLLILVSWLFALETVRGQRYFLGGARAQCDNLLIKSAFGLSRLRVHLGAGSARIAIHFFFHQLLAVILKGLQRFESFIASVQRRNRAVARSVRSDQKKTHLDVLVEHKEAHSLSEKQKQALKDKSIGV